MPPKSPAPDPEVARRHTRRVRRAPGVPPRVVHGTRVAFRVVCDACGADDTLPFVPKTKGSVFCSKCAAERFGEGWDKGRTEKPREFEFQCVSCGAEDFVSFEPEDPSAMLCGRCLRGESAPTHGRVGGDVIDRRGGVRRRKSVGVDQS